MKNSLVLSARPDQRHARPDERSPASADAPRAASTIQAPCALPPACRGFTLIELMIAVAVAGVLSSVAVPSFEALLQRARRADALVSMLHVQTAQERFRSNSPAYGSLAEIGVASVSAAGHYSLQASASGASGYDALATALGRQARDTACRYLALRSTGGNLVYASGPDAAVANPAAVNRTCRSL